MKPPLLFLSHRIPYPPNKGDKIRSYNLLRYLSKRFRVFLGTFIDNASDWDHISKVEALCEECCFIDLDPRLARIKSISGLLTGKPLSVPYYSSSQLREWIRTIVKTHGISQLMVYSSPMAQYAMTSGHGFDRRVIDFVDIDSDKWRQYALKRTWPMNWVYRREADYLLDFEKRVASCFDVSLFVSSAEAEMFEQLSGGQGGKVDFYPNGVDIDYFSSDKPYSNPYSSDEKALVFTGAMDYWPNIDAVDWFGREIFPEILRADEAARFYIVGGNPTEKVQQLQKLPGIVVTGRVDDVRPYIHHAEAALAPMRIARGVQNKVLEAMAMGKPTIVTPQGLEGIDAEDGNEVLVAGDGEAFVERILSVLKGEWEDVGDKARDLIRRAYTWDDVLPKLDQWLPVDR
jgi:sugar transferase (PEP-CTERM/EpsH1 system associated)